jgi:hypothetical protein
MTDTLLLHPPYSLPVTSSATVVRPLVRGGPYVPPAAGGTRTHAPVLSATPAPGAFAGLAVSGGFETPFASDASGSPDASAACDSSPSLEAAASEPWGTTASEHEPVLPSIEEFLLAADPEVVEAEAARVAEAAALSGASADSDGAHAAPEASSAGWPIEEAAEALAALARELPSTNDAVALPSPSQPLPLWTEDEQWMDIMPALPTAASRDVEGETAWARAFAEPPAPLEPALPAGDAEAAAASLEAIARRLRAGDLAVPGYRAERGEAAALAAALASLLDARR